MRFIESECNRDISKVNVLASHAETRFSSASWTTPP
jgi:hypothetical protein